MEAIDLLNSINEHLTAAAKGLAEFDLKKSHDLQERIAVAKQDLRKQQLTLLTTMMRMVQIGGTTVVYYIRGNSGPLPLHLVPEKDGFWYPRLNELKPTATFVDTYPHHYPRLTAQLLKTLRDRIQSSTQTDEQATKLKEMFDQIEGLFQPA